MRNYDVLTTIGKTEFIYIHVHKHGDRQCYWLGRTDHGGKLQVFSDATYAAAIPVEDAMEVLTAFAMQHPELSELKSWECSSDLYLSPAMRKVLRV